MQRDLSHACVKTKSFFFTLTLVNSRHGCRARAKIAGGEEQKSKCYSNRESI